VQGCIKLLGFSFSSIGWGRGLGRGGAFLLVSPPRSSPLVPRGERMESLMQPCRRVRPRRSRSPKELGQRGLTRSRGIFLTTPIALCYGSYSDAKCESGQPKRMNSERAMESIGNGRLRVGEHVPPSPPGEGEAKDAPRGYWDRPQRSAACGHSGEPKLINPKCESNRIMFAYVRLCSLMFA